MLYICVNNMLTYHEVWRTQLVLILHQNTVGATYGAQKSVLMMNNLMDPEQTALNNYAGRAIIGH